MAALHCLSFFSGQKQYDCIDATVSNQAKIGYQEQKSLMQKKNSPLLKKKSPQHIEVPLFQGLDFSFHFSILLGEKRN